ncbi:hypothetical protein ABTF80_21575, partial [Acinetobacter baumannii]
GYDPAAVTDGARAAIRWTYYGGIITLLLAQIGIVLAWPNAQTRRSPDEEEGEIGLTPSSI